VVKKKVEDQRERDPDDRPRGGFTKANRVRFAVEDAEIDGEENENETNETCVKPPVLRKWKKLNHTSSFHIGKVLVVELYAFPASRVPYKTPC
jgi:hypothetical protein